jgi:uncharacterized membrane protein
MPYEWTPSTSDPQSLRLWPHRSLTNTGFVWFIGVTAALIAVPLVSLIGQPILWGFLPFVMGAVASIWWALQRNANDRQILEELHLARDTVSLVRKGPRGRVQKWQANPYWVRVTVHANRGPVPHYVTLSGNGREVEIGAFLSEAERQALATELREHLAALH